ncbi:bifunctional diguanylate cyclase/phosphodiesterase [Blastococcus sp. LR1]|uniref:putative bifunctional diguanylate cyclase/phosphodiesterase n=1 Tax=Blastococcus sp. LR1 TaxID=2877000 RepID=UPI001CCC421F|nr:GGDEF domain-containing phosphodiesterase [Blastococcus sp. LR1]MCA0144907.1 EAL domain-containing protein [Blastococcus sp. LR1]
MTTAPDPGQPTAANPTPPPRGRAGFLPVLCFGLALVAVVPVLLPGHPLLRALSVLLGLAPITAALTAVCRRQQLLAGDLRRSQAAFRTLAKSSVDPVVILDEQLRVTFASPALAGVLGREPGEMLGLPLEPVIHPDDRAGLFGANLQRRENGEFAVRTARVRAADGQWRLMQATVRDLRNDPDVGALVLHCRDVTSRGRGVDPELLELSLADPVTGLPNRTALSRRLAAVQRTVAASPVALVLLSIDGVAGATSRPGTEETVLRVLTSRLSRELRGEDWLARGKDGDFVVLVDGTVSDAEVVATRLVSTLGYIATPAGPLTATAGVTGLAADIDPGEALRRADLALSSACSAGVGSVHRYDDALRNAQDRRSTLAVDLAGALERGELRLAFQPVVDVVLHRTVSVEALLRWRHPELGDVSPQEFVPLAEESPLITELGRWVLREACSTVARTTDDELSVAVNVSARQVRSGQLVSDVVAALESSALPASRLIVEITESMLLDEHVAADLETLRGLGVRIAVDDFGTGWSSLAYLVGMPVDLLKMDQHFLAHVETDPQRRALCRAILQLGTTLNLPVIVEGVATPAVLALLRDMGHRFVQGYAFSRPLEAEQLAAGVWRTVPYVASAPPGVPA